MKKLTDEERENIEAMIENEGFDYYFLHYGADPKLKAIIGDEIKTFQAAESALTAALQRLGIEI